MISKKTFTFLKALQKNNNKPWFDLHKDDYLAAKQDVQDFIEVLIRELTTFDKSLNGLTAKECMFRIYRDVRFAKDKRPYKNNMGASINSGGKKSQDPGYYVHIQPGSSFIAGGLWMPPADQLKKIRQEIDYNGKQIHKILDDSAFKKYFGGLDTASKRKTAPKGYPKDHPDIDLLKFNNFVVWHKFDDKIMLGKNVLKELVKGAKIMKPFTDFLKTAVS